MSTSSASPQASMVSAQGAPYRGNTFAMALPEGWSEDTVHVLRGPTVGGHAHAITVQTLFGVEASALDEFAGPLVETAERSLRQAQLLVFDTIALDEALVLDETGPRDQDRVHQKGRGDGPRARPGRHAKRTIMKWHPEGADGPRYQEQLFVLAAEGPVGYVLTASFSQDSRHLLGTYVERIMRSLHPGR